MVAADIEMRRPALQGLFSSFDLDGNGSVGVQELMQVVQATKRDGNRKRLKVIRQLEAVVSQAVMTNQKTGVSNSIALKTGGHITFAEVNGEPQLDPEAFVNLLLHLTADVDENGFDEFVEVSRHAVDEAYQRTQGTSLRKVIWNMFQQIDVNSDGFVDMSELELLLNIETKHDKKAVSKWKNILSQKQLEAHKFESASRPGSATNREAGIVQDASAEAIAEIEAEVSGSANKEDSLRLTLADFQHFIFEFTDEKEERITNLYEAVAKHMRERHQAYLDENKVGAVMDAVLEDILRERPKDVLEGIIRSCKRMQRVGHSHRTLTRVKSVIKVEDRRETSPGATA